MLLTLRALALVLIAGWQAFAATAFAAPLCGMSAAPVNCHCPHVRAGTTPEAAVRQGTCCNHELSRADVTPAVVDSSRSSVAPSPVALPPCRIAEAPRASFTRPLAWTVSPPSHGPPLYLSLRTLLN